MCDENEESRDTHDSEEADEKLSLLDLPVEIFLYICSFLEVPTLIYSLGLVCKQFHLILKDEFFWKARVARIWPDTSYPILRSANSKVNKVFWRTLCARAEKQKMLWKHEDYVEEFTVPDDNHSDLHNTTDGLLLMHDGTICIVGARDRTLICWNIPTSGNKTSFCVNYAHDGWIWDVTAIDNTVYSCSWDHTIKSWALMNSGLVPQTVYQIDGASNGLCALLSITSCPERALFATGAYNKLAYVFDSRSGQMPIRQYRAHNRAVIKMTMNSEYILSVSDDATMTVWDQRTTRIMKSIAISNEAYPTCISTQRDTICLGDNIGRLHVLNRNFELVKSYCTEHTKAIKGVHLSDDRLITASVDGTVRILSPTDPPKSIAVKTSGFGEIANMQYQNDVLAISGINVKIWRPKSVHAEKV